MIFEYNNYRSFLKAELADRIASNGQYSLRSFALGLGISHGALSQVFKGTKNISFERAMDIAKKLELKELETEYFCLLVQFETVKDEELKSSILEKINRLKPQKKFNDLSLDAFRVISDWYHFPILSLTRIKGFKFTSKNIAKRLGISEFEVLSALERLERVELIEKDENGNWIESKSYVMANSETPSTALRKYHRQMLEKAMDSIDKQVPQKKVNGSETFAIHNSVLDEARNLMEKYFNSMVELSEKSQKELGANDVYHLQVNFFSLMQGEQL